MNATPRPLGPWTATALVVGSMIGSGVFLLPASLAPYGALGLLGWAVTLCGALLLAATFARLSMRWPQTGGPYAYARNAFGEPAGFVVAWSYWISTCCGNAAIAIAFAGSFGALVPAATATPLRGAGCALAALLACTLVNLGGLRGAGRLQVLATALKALPLLLFGGIAIWALEPARLHAPASVAGGTFGALQATVALTLWAFQGLEVATVPAGAIADPSRTIPRATLFGTLLAGIATILACTAVLGIVDAGTLAHSSAPMADAAGRLWGRPAAVAVALLAAVSCFGALNGWVLVAAQLPFGMARDGVFPRAFARCDARGTPVVALLVGACLSALLIAANYSRSLVQVFTFAILLSTAATLLPYVASSAAWLCAGGGKGRIVATLALLYSLYALVGTGVESLLWGGVLLLAGLPVYAMQRRARATRT